MSASADQTGVAERDKELVGPKAPTWLVAFSLISGITAWMVHLSGASALVPTACARDMGWLIDGLTLITALVCLAGVLASVRIMRLAGKGENARSQGYRFIGFIGLVANVFSFVLVLGEGAMHIWVAACR